MDTAQSSLELLVVIAIASIALSLVGITGITHTVLRNTQASSVDRARFLVISMFGLLVAIGAYLPILISRWINEEINLFRVCTFVYLCLVIWGERWRASYPQITNAIERMYRESQYPSTFSNVLRTVAAIVVVINLASWPVTSGQALYELLLVFTFMLALLHFVNLVIFRIADSAILENPIYAGWEAVIYEPPGDEGKVLKLFNFYDRSSADHEVEMTKTAYEAGLPCPKIYGDVIEMQHRFGFYTEKIEGKSFADRGVYGQSKVAAELSAEFGRFHASIHKVEGVIFPSKFRDVAIGSIKNPERLSSKEKSGMLALLDQLPDGDRVYHGDCSSRQCDATQSRR